MLNEVLGALVRPDWVWGSMRGHLMLKEQRILQTRLWKKEKKRKVLGIWGRVSRKGRRRFMIFVLEFPLVSLFTCCPIWVFLPEMWELNLKLIEMASGFCYGGFELYCVCFVILRQVGLFLVGGFLVFSFQEILQLWPLVCFMEELC